MAKHLQQLRQLAQLCGVQTAYSDVNRQRRPASADSLLKVVRVFGVPLESMTDVADALRERRQMQWQRLCEPVFVVWEGQRGRCVLRLPEKELQNGVMKCCLRLESGEEQQWSLQLDQLPVRGHTEVEGVQYSEITLQLPTPLPVGYHQLRLLWQEQSWESLVVAAPRKAYTPPEKMWVYFSRCMRFTPREVGVAET